MRNLLAVVVIPLVLIPATKTWVLGKMLGGDPINTWPRVVWWSAQDRAGVK